jgi:predicted phosphodiesterase
MKISIHSDLHLELQDLPVGFLSTVPDILILAGDIHYAKENKLISFLEELLSQYESMQILFVFGNHEFYRHDNMLAAEERLKQQAESYERLHILQCDSVCINGVRFLGCTSWSDFESVRESEREVSKLESQHRINDFRVIGTGDNKIFTVDDCISFGKKHRAWLERELDKDFDGKTVVITHFPPSIALSHPLYPVEGNPLTGYFVCNNQALIDRYQPDVWIFGHTHANYDTHSDKTRLVSNQKGYGRECQDSYESDKVIVL